MLQVRHTLVEDNVPRVEFACDISACKGACCTLPGGKGAPLLDHELEPLRESFAVVQSQLPREHLDAVARSGLYEGSPGEYTTMCYDNRACVFVMYDNGFARCSIEKAYHDGKLKWRKPLSCHLFPIRIDYGEMPRLRYEYLNECDAALERGTAEKVRMVDFLQEPLVRAFGLSWYKDFLRACRQVTKEPAADGARQDR